MFKRNQIVTVGIAGVHSQYQGKILRRAPAFGGTDGWWIVREMPEDAERTAFFKSMPMGHGMCVHESQLAVVQ